MLEIEDPVPERGIKRRAVDRTLHQAPGELEAIQHLNLGPRAPLDQLAAQDLGREIVARPDSDILIDELFDEIDKWIADGMQRPKRLKMAKPAALAMAEASLIPLGE